MSKKLLFQSDLDFLELIIFKKWMSFQRYFCFIFLVICYSHWNFIIAPDCTALEIKNRQIGVGEVAQEVRVFLLLQRTGCSLPSTHAR